MRTHRLPMIVMVEPDGESALNYCAPLESVGLKVVRARSLAAAHYYLCDDRVELLLVSAHAIDFDPQLIRSIVGRTGRDIRVGVLPSLLTPLELATAMPAPSEAILSPERVVGRTAYLLYSSDPLHNEFATTCR